MIQLRYFEAADVPQLMQWINHEALLINWAGSLFTFPLTNESMDWYISDVNQPGKSSAFVYKAVHAETGETVGHISLGGISKKNRAGRISRVLVGPQFQGNGYCCQMVRQLLQIGFEDMQLHRISLGVYDFNKSAIQCYQKSGFVIEGKSRDMLRFGTEWWSLVEMSILESEWLELKEKG